MTAIQRAGTGLPVAPNSLLTWSLGSAVSAALLVQIYSGLGLLALYGDGAYCLRAMLSSRQFACIESPRRATQMLLESETLAAIRLGLTSLDWIEAIFSLSLQLTPLALTCLCFAAVWRADRRFVLFPALAYFAGSSGIASNQFLEGPATAAWFWLLLSLVLFRSSTVSRCLWLILSALPAIAIHEAMVFLAPLLAMAAWSRSSRGATPGTRWLLLALSAWFATVACRQFYYVLSPIHPANRDGFILQMLAFKWLYASGFGLNVPASLGLLACAAVLIIWWKPRLTSVWLGGFLVAALALTAMTFLTPAGRAPAMQFYARDQPAFLSVPLALIALWLARRPERWRTVPVARAGVVLLILALTTSAVQAAVTADRDRYLTALRGVLHDATGVVSWEAMTRALPAADAPLFARMDWGWTWPDLSLLLAEQGLVRAIIANPVGQPWQPWDPSVPSEFPGSAFWHIQWPGAPVPAVRGVAR